MKSIKYIETENPSLVRRPLFHLLYPLLENCFLWGHKGAGRAWHSWYGNGFALSDHSSVCL